MKKIEVYKPPAHNTNKSEFISMEIANLDELNDLLNDLEVCINKIKNFKPLLKIVQPNLQNKKDASTVESKASKSQTLV